VTAAEERPLIWFERPVLPALMSVVDASCTVLGPGTPDDRYAGINPAVAAVVGSAPFDGPAMDRAPALRVIARTGIGYDSVDVPAATARGIAVTNTPDGPTISTAEHAVMLMLMAAKRVQPSVAALRTGSADNFYARHQGIELAGKTLGLVGLGRIARRVATAAGAMAMHVVAFDPYIDPSGAPPGVQLVAVLDDLLRVADVVSVHVPLTDASRGLFDAGRFAAMQRGAVFVNTGRGAIVDQDALLSALETGQVFAAGLDVTDPEPLPAGHPLLHRDDVVVTPHIASATADGKLRSLESAFEQAMAVVNGDRPEHLVNPQVWDRLAAGTSATTR
jgi:D-3-phosphoglycerate dehydrogenase